MIPTIGRIVLFQSDEGREPLPACIFGVRKDGHVDLTILRAGMSDIRYIPFSETLKVGHWSWPVLVAENDGPPAVEIPEQVEVPA